MSKNDIFSFDVRLGSSTSSDTKVVFELLVFFFLTELLNIK